MVLNRRATEFDTQAKNWQGPPGRGGSGDMFPRKILKFHSRRDNCSLKLEHKLTTNTRRAGRGAGGICTHQISIDSMGPPFFISFLQPTCTEFHIGKF